MKFLFFPLAFLAGRLYFLADTFAEAQVFHCLGLHVLLLSILVYLVCITPYKLLERKLFWLIFTVYESCALAMYSIVQYEIITKYSQSLLFTSWSILSKSGAEKVSPIFYAIQNIGVPVFIVILGYIIYYKLKKLDHSKSVSLNNETAFLLLRYPKNFIGLLLSIFWKYPVNTVSLYIEGYKYGYTKCTKTFVKEPFDYKSTGSYFIKDTGISKDLALSRVKGLLGTKWTWKLNCLNFYKSITGSLDGK